MSEGIPKEPPPSRTPPETVRYVSTGIGGIIQGLNGEPGTRPEPQRVVASLTQAQITLNVLADYLDSQGNHGEAIREALSILSRHTGSMGDKIHDAREVLLAALR